LEVGEGAEEGREAAESAATKMKMSKIGEVSKVPCMSIWPIGNVIMTYI
jgi:hypothetical protein